MTCKILIAGEVPRRFTALEERNGGSNGVRFEHVGVNELKQRLAETNGDPVMVVAGTGTDVKELRELREQHPDIPFVFESNPERNEDLGSLIDRYDQIRTDFLARLSHEVRSPLGVVVGVLGELEATLPMDDDTRQLLALADRGVRRLRNLSEGLMEVAELESLPDTSQLPVERSPVDARDIVQTAIERVKAAESRSNIHIEVDVPNEPVMANVDARRIERVVAILVSNAMRFASKRAEITLRQSGGDLKITAEDDGPGIAADVRKDVFHRFVGRHLQGRKSGVAFGLSIANDYVKAHGGRIDIEDARPDALEGEHRGTRVIVTVPRQTA